MMSEEKGQRGWICPVCGSGLAPWVDKCPCMNVMKLSNEVNPADPDYISERLLRQATHPRER